MVKVQTFRYSHSKLVGFFACRLKNGAALKMQCRRQEQLFAASLELSEVVQKLQWDGLLTQRKNKQRSERMPPRRML